jgi:glycosyltransferase involved in cell wall biosynthesis
MRVLLVTHYYAEHRGGVEIIAGELAERMAPLGVETDWVASAGPPAARTPQGIRRLPVPAWNFTERRLGFPYPLWGPRALFRLGRQVRSCDVVHLHDSLYLGNVTAYLWARWHRKPVIVTQHIGPVPYSSRLLRGMLGLAYRTLARMVLGGCDQVVFYSPRVRDYFTRLVRFRRPPRFQPNGVDSAVFRPADEEERQALRARFGWPAGRKVRLFVGRFVEKKGLPLLRQLAAARPQDLWVFVGWGPDEPAAWGLSNVLSVGALPQSAIADYYRAADLLVLPSVGEGFPLVVQEAMACGLPPLITPETLEGAPDARGVVACAEPDVASWHREIDRLDALPSRRRAVADFARGWDWDAAAAEYAALYESLPRSARPLALALQLENAHEEGGEDRLHAEHE